MTYSDIDVYLKAFGVDTKKKTSSTNSKWLYVKELLSDAAESTLFELADELGIEHSFQNSRGIELRQSKFWVPGYFRLFISHLSPFKETAAKLQIALLDFGITAFVAHNDIEPTKEWQEEIEKGLFSMEALAAILTPGFRESNWTDQETGVAIGRDVLVIPIMRGINPYGFIAKYQGLMGAGKTVRQVADGVFQILANHPKTKPRLAESLVDQILLAHNIVSGLQKLNLLRRIETLPEQYLEKLRDGIVNNQQLSASGDVNRALNDMLRERGLSTLSEQQAVGDLTDDDIPF
ncbi:MAG TPA: toll/interleukin-1 receptor domain-containing protein [Pyrinomonadaceae bacterium]|nr:toll/interleukin-1 receptor domain-containing protein [Pyrinomonadaceae bacterium]